MDTYLTRFDVDRVSVLSGVSAQEVPVPWPGWMTQTGFSFREHIPPQTPTPGVDLNFDRLQPGGALNSIAL